MKRKLTLFLVLSMIFTLNGCATKEAFQENNGLASTTYKVNLSASHIGKDMYGAYFGDFGYESSADLSGLESVMTAWSGSMEYDGDVWFKNERFMFSLDQYDEIYTFSNVVGF